MSVGLPLHIHRVSVETLPKGNLIIYHVIVYTLARSKGLTGDLEGLPGDPFSNLGNPVY